MCLWTTIFPFDVVKSRIQVAGSSEAMVPLLLKIIKQEGKMRYSVSFLGYHHAYK